MMWYRAYCFAVTVHQIITLFKDFSDLTLFLDNSYKFHLIGLKHGEQLDYELLFRDYSTLNFDGSLKIVQACHGFMVAYNFLSTTSNAAIFFTCFTILQWWGIMQSLSLLLFLYNLYIFVWIWHSSLATLFLLWIPTIVFWRGCSV